jgi:hypothetical protein
MSSGQRYSASDGYVCEPDRCESTRRRRDTYSQYQRCYCNRSAIHDLDYRVWRQQLLSDLLSSNRYRVIVSRHIAPIFVAVESGETRVAQAIAGLHCKNSIRATMNGANQRHIAIFATVRPSPQRLSPRSGRLTNGHRGIRNSSRCGWRARRNSVGMPALTLAAYMRSSPL